MIKFRTEVDIQKSDFRLGLSDKILMLGSCFVDNVADKMLDSGLNVLSNPFGPLYNPISVRNSMRLLTMGREFSEEDCVPMGARAGKICSFYHHTSFSRLKKEEFIEHANASLEEAAKFYKDSDVIIITLGTSWCYQWVGGSEEWQEEYSNLMTKHPEEYDFNLDRSQGMIVSNCLKRNANEFRRIRLSVGQCALMLEEIVKQNLDRKIIFTLSPVRHLKDGAHEGQVSKAALMLAIDSVISKYSESCVYFPSYEIMMDELRDYRFYAEDLAHPSNLAVEYIWERFCDMFVDNKDREEFARNVKKAKRERHRTII